MIDLNKLKKLAEAASPGPWKVGGSNGRMIYDAQGYLCGDSDLLANAEFKAAANPAAILELIAMASAAAPQVVEDKRAEIRAFEDFARKACQMPDGIAVNWGALWTQQAYEGWQARAALASAPVQAQEPVMRKCNRFAHACNCTRDCPETGQVGGIARAPVQPVAVPDGIVNIGVAQAALEAWFEEIGIDLDTDDAARLFEAMTASAPECCGSTEFCERVACPAQGDAKELTDDEILKVYEETISYIAKRDDVASIIAFARAAIAAKAVTP